MPNPQARQATAGPSSPTLRRRFTRATSHFDEPSPSESPAPEGLTATSTSSSAETSPERDEYVLVDEMLHREGAAARRSKNIEDINDIEEKGLYRSQSNASSFDGGPREKLLDDRARSERSPSDEKEGLHSRRDREAFALLVVLCKSLTSSLRTGISTDT